MDNMQIARELLRIQAADSKWLDAINNNEYIQIESPVGGCLAMQSLALDVLGVSRDPGCRDWAMDLYWSMVEEKGDIEGYIKVMLADGVVQENE